MVEPATFNFYPIQGYFPGLMYSLFLYLGQKEYLAARHLCTH